MSALPMIGGGGGIDLTEFTTLVEIQKWGTNGIYGCINGTLYAQQSLYTSVSQGSLSIPNNTSITFTASQKCKVIYCGVDGSGSVFDIGSAELEIGHTVVMTNKIGYLLLIA